MLLRYDSVSGEPEGVFEQDADRERQAVEPAQALPFKFRQAVDDGLLPIHREGAARTEGIWSGAHREACARRGSLVAV